LRVAGFTDELRLVAVEDLFTVWATADVLALKFPSPP